MSIFNDLKSEGLEETQDRLGGMQVRPTDAYLAVIKAAYAGVSAGGARNVTLVLAVANSDYTETIYITDKDKKNYFLNKNDNTKKVPLPGFTTINDICIVTTGKELFEQADEEKIVKIYDYDEKKELPKAVRMLVELIGKTFYAGIIHSIVDKNAKDESTGKYEPTGETREENNIEKVFHDPTKMTVPEARAVQAGGSTPDPLFFDMWLDKNKGTVKNKSKSGNSPKTGNSSSGSGAPQSGATTQKKTNSLFGSK